MGKITYIYGPMRSGKTELLIEKIQYFKNTNSEVLVLKPSVDTRDNVYIKSRAKDIKVLSHGISDVNSLIGVHDTILGIPKDREINIFVDEIHFLSDEVLDNIIYMFFQTKNVRNNINLYLCGLQYSFLHEEFNSHMAAEKYSDATIEVRGLCERCKSEKSMYNCLFIDGKLVTEGDIYMPGDSEYKILCGECLYM